MPGIYAAGCTRRDGVPGKLRRVPVFCIKGALFPHLVCSTTLSVISGNISWWPCADSVTQHLVTSSRFFQRSFLGSAMSLSPSVVLFHLCLVHVPSPMYLCTCFPWLQVLSSRLSFAAVCCCQTFVPVVGYFQVRAGRCAIHRSLKTVVRALLAAGPILLLTQLVRALLVTRQHYSNL